MDYRAELSALIARTLREAEGDRYDVAARMSRLTGTDVSKYMLDAYASSGRDAYNLPLWLAPALETACATHDLASWHGARVGARMLVGAEAIDAELGRLERIREHTLLKIRALRRLREGT